MSSAIIHQFVSGLKSRHADVRSKAVHDFSLYVKSELLEASADEINGFLDDCNHHIFDMVSGNDVNEKKGGILAIGTRNLFSNKLIYKTNYFSMPYRNGRRKHDDKNLAICKLLEKFIAF